MRSPSSMRRGFRPRKDRIGHFMNRESSKSEWIANSAACALLLLAGLLAYSNSFSGVFLLDDNRSIVNNPGIRTFANSESASGSFQQRWVGWWSFKLNYALGGLDMAGYHVVNLAVHLAAGLLLFGLVRRTLLLRPPDDRIAQAACPLAFAVAVVWVVHPLGTQGVTYIVQRFESLMGMLYLACLYCMVRGGQSPRPWMWYLLAGVACWLGMFTKEIMITAPLVAIVYDRVFLAESWREVLRRRWGLHAGCLSAAVALIAAVVWNQSAARSASAGFGFQLFTWTEYLGSQGGVILHYLRLAAWPDRLCLDYLWPVARSPIEIFLPCAAVAALLVGSIAALRYYLRVAFLGLAFFLVLAPTSSVMPIADLAVEHRMYLPLVPLVVLAVLGVFALAGRLLQSARWRRCVEAALLTAVVVAFAWRTHDRNQDYRSKIAMWTDVLATSPENIRAHHYLGKAMANEGDVVGGIRQIQRALEIDPRFARAHNDLGHLFAEQEELSQARVHFEQAIAIDSEYVDPHYNLAVTLNKLGRVDEAADQYRQAIRIKPNYLDAYNNLGNILLRQGKVSEAVVEFERLLKIDANYPQAYVSLGTASIERGEFHQAVAHFRSALEFQPGLISAATNLTWVLAACEDGSVREAEEAVRLGEQNAEITQRRDPIVLDSLAAAYAEARRWDEAVSTANEAVTLASAAGRQRLAEEISNRRQLYQQQQPYRFRTTGGRSR